MRKFFPVPLLFLAGLLLVAGCDEGIQPPSESDTGPQQSGFAGTITYRNWPAPDSLFDLRLIAFKTFPPASILTEVLSGQAIIYPALGDTSLPFNVDTTRYFVPAPAGEYRYIVVAQQFGPNLLTDWRAVGQYDLDADLTVPSPIQVPANRALRNVDILVDFAHRPPQPF